MLVNKVDESATKVTLLVVVDKEQIDKHLNQVLSKLSKTLSLPGFRKGHIPAAMVQKNVDPSVLQNDFLDSILNDVYFEAVNQVKIVPATTPQVSIKKFVPYESLELGFEVEVVGKITLPDLKTLKTKKAKPTISSKDVNKVIDDLRLKEATREESKTAAKEKDEIIFDFEGKDQKTKEVIEGAVASDYPLILGSKSFIPGFEEELIGLKKGDEKEFVITFPSDYHQVELRSKKTVFKVKVKKINSLVLAKLDEDFFSKVGPFKTIDDLSKAINDQLSSEQNNQLKQDFDNKIVEELIEKTKIDLPESLIQTELDRILEQDKAAVASRNQTFEQHLKDEGVTEEEHTKINREMAIKQIKAGLLLSRLAQDLKIEVSDNELDGRINLMKNYYQSDEYMVKELESENNRQDIKNRMQIEKTLDHLDKLLNK